MLLALVFFIMFFSSILWLFYALAYVAKSLGDAAFSSLPIAEFAQYLSIIILPVVALWIVFGFINQYIGNRKYNQNFLKLFLQIKRAQEYTDLIARVLIEGQKQVADVVAVNRNKLLLSDINELIADILCNVQQLSQEDVEKIWQKCHSGSCSAFGKVFLSVNQKYGNFSLVLFEKASSDSVLAGSILEFVARYNALIDNLEKHDKERNILVSIETGVLGKVFSILSPAADKLKQLKDFSKNIVEETVAEPEIKANEPMAVVAPQEEKKSRFAPLSMFKKPTAFEEKKEPEFEAKDAFSEALERSFAEPVAEPEVETSPTLQTINNLQKEWSASKEEKDTNDVKAAYPFSGWTDEENYNK